MQVTFPTPITTWVVDHAYGDDQPHVDAYALDNAWLLVEPVHTTGRVEITFGKPTAGRVVLTDTGGGGGGPSTTIPVTKPSIGRPVSGRMR